MKKILFAGFGFFYCLCCLAQSKSTLFEILPSRSTGIKFENKIVDTKSANILIYSNFYGGAGVGTGDFNLDGLPDVFFAGNQVDDQLYLNLGDFKFKNITEKAGINSNDGWSSGVVIADVNNDGYPDIYVTRELYDEEPDRRKNKLYINQQNSTFLEKSDEFGIGDDGRTRHATFFDYNKDGLLDLFLLNQPPNPGNYSSLKGIDLTQEKFAPKLYQNDGTKFIDVTQKAGLGKTGFPNSVAAADLNGDGWTDIYVTNDYDAPDFFYINQGDGTFKDILTEAVNHISYYSMGIDAADLTNNGLLDIMVLDMVAEDNYRLKANMSGMDISAFWKVVNDGGHYQYMFNTLQMNHGNSVYSEVGQIAGISATDWSWSNLIADFDNDGWKDIHVTNGLLRDIRNTDAAKEFSKYVTKVINEYIQQNPNDPDVTIWKILDLKKALEIVPSQKVPNYSFKNLGDLKFENSSAAWGLNQASFSTGSAYADLDLDGDIDLIVNNLNEEAYVYRNNTNNSANYFRVKLLDQTNAPIFGSKITITTSEGKQFAETMNVRGMYSTSEDIVHFGVGEDTDIQALEIIWPDGTVTNKTNLKVNQVLEVEKDSKTEIPSRAPLSPIFTKAAIPGLKFNHIENIFDDFEKQILLPHKLSQNGPTLSVGDVNGDDLEDIFVGGAAGQAAALYFQQANGNFLKDENKRWESDRMYEDVASTLFDFDGDGDLDLYVVSGGNEAEPGSKFYLDRFYLNNGTGRFLRANILPEISSSGSVVRAGDFDKDGDLDLFVGGRLIPQHYPEPASSFILVNNENRFWDKTAEIAPALQSFGMVTDAIWSDYDADGDDDLLIVGEWMTVNILINENGVFEKKTDNTLENNTGWLFSIEEIDSDGDKSPDYLVGNLGYNYKYKATEKEPFDLFYHDFDNNQSKDIVLGYYNQGKHFPVRGRSCSTQQVPLIGQKFETYDLFASSTLEEIYQIDKIDEEIYLKATNFSHFILKNPSGDLIEINSLPHLAQISSINDWVTIDLNQDGKMDVIGAGGLFQAEIETQRNDASVGIVLLGTDNGYKLLPFEETGLYLKYDVKKLATISIKGETHLIVANNNGPLEVFKISQKLIP